MNPIPPGLQIHSPRGCTSEETLFCLVRSESEFSPVARATTAMYPSQNLCAAAGLSAHRGLADLLLARGNFNYQQHFFNQGRAYYGQMRRCGRPGTASPPCKSASVVSCSGCCDRTRSRRSRLQVMCFHKAAGEEMLIYGEVFIYCWVFYWMSAASPPPPPPS